MTVALPASSKITHMSPPAPDENPARPAKPAGPLLAMDTSGRTARVALVAHDGRVLASGERTSDRHSSILLPLCSELLDQAGLRAENLGGLACGAGPGSFTGLRVGLAVAKGLAFATGRPIFLVSSLEALARDLAGLHPQARLVVPCIDAGKGEVYAQRFASRADELRPLAQVERLAPQTLREALAAEPSAVVVAGTGVDRFGEQLAPPESARARWLTLFGFAGPTATAVAGLALARWGVGTGDDLDASVPLYGRPPDITKPKPRG